MKRFKFALTVALTMLSGGMALEAGAAMSFMITGQGMSNNQQYSADALSQAEQQALDNATAQCDTNMTGNPGRVSGLRIVYRSTYRQNNGLFGAVANASGTCIVGSDS